MKKLLWLWQFPQHLFALALIKYIQSKYNNTQTDCIINGMEIHKTIFESNFIPGVSLGKYIFLSTQFTGDYLTITLQHEQGHSVQSIILGPLYLFTIGILSICGNILSRYWKWLYTNYYNQPWEKWADILGKVKR